MIDWKRQGPAVVGAVTLSDGRPANVVLVGARANPNGVAVVFAGKPGQPPQTLLLSAQPALLSTQTYLEVLCMQERVFGQSALPVPPALKG